MIASTTQGQIGVEDAAPGWVDVVADAPPPAEEGAFVELAVLVAVDVDVDVTVDVDVEVFVEVEVEVEVLVAVLVELVADDAEDEDVRVAVLVLVGASPVGATGVRDGRSTERDPLGRFEPPAHATISTSTTAASAPVSGRRLSATVASPFDLATPHLSRVAERRRATAAVAIAVLAAGCASHRRAPPAGRPREAPRCPAGRRSPMSVRSRPGG
jgi:hypothetical protein